MRPLELELRNFRSYYGTGGRFDFRDRRLIGVVGPIGAGKSSLLDAIAFALYGKTPTSGSNRKSLIHQRTGDMAVKFRFAVGDEIWEVVRSLRRKGQAQHALYRLASDAPTTPEPGGDIETQAQIVEKITMDGPVNERIVELLGLDYDAFGRSVMLAQNRFSEFLGAGPTQRDMVLKGVFGHERIDQMRSHAKTMLATAENELDKLVVRTEQLDGVGARLAEATVAHTAAAKRLQTLQGAKRDVEQLQSRARTAAEAAKAARSKLDGFTESGDVPPAEAQTAPLLEAAASAAGRRTELAGVLEQQGELLAAAEADLNLLGESGEDGLIDKASTLITQRAMQQHEIDQGVHAANELARQITEASQREATLQAEHTAAQETEQSAVSVLSLAANAVEEATQRLTVAERTDMANVIRAALVVGDPCPVCSQEVSAVPDSAPLDALAGLKSALTHARADHEAAQTQRTEAVAERTRIAEALKSQMAGRGEAESRHQQQILDVASREKDLQHVIAELDSLLGAGDHTALLDERRQVRAAAVRAVGDRKQELERTRQLHEEAVRDGQAVDREMSSLVSLLAALGAKLGESISADRDRPDQVAALVAHVRQQWNLTLEALQLEIKQADAEQSAATETLERLLTELEVERSLPEDIASVEATMQHLDKEIARHENELASAETLLAEKAAKEREIEVYTQLVDDLRDSQFIRFLLDEERSRLAALGSEHFLRLSSGRYAFTEDGEFAIVDLTSADAVRKAASLSGGETFLASLALALALAEMVARTGGRLDAFFLDEGFGSLDAEHLDLAMEGIEALVTDNRDRLVVVVSHVPELRQRIDDRIQLDRDPLTGDTRIIRA